MCEQSCSPVQMEAWEKLRDYLYSTRNLYQEQLAIINNKLCVTKIVGDCVRVRDITIIDKISFKLKRLFNA